MSDSTFNADLDAIVRGEDITSAHELTHFVSGLYREERNVTMPNAQKLRLANDLGLSAASEPGTISVPVSRRTLRAAGQVRERQGSRPWTIALAVAAALLIVAAGVLRFGLPNGTDEADNQFLLSSPAVPTVVATPGASPGGDEAWLKPITPEECMTEDFGDLPDASPEDLETLAVREFNLVGPAEFTDAVAANDVVRQYFACQYPPSLLSGQYANLVSLTGGQFSPQYGEILQKGLDDGVSLSRQLEEHGVTPADTLTVPLSTSAEQQSFFGPSPEMAFVLEDGRVVMLSASSLSTEQTAIGTGVVLVQENGEWKIDGNLPVCLGDCEDVFGLYESTYKDALWLLPITAEECVLNDMLPDGISDEETAAIRSRQYGACETDGDAAQLQGPDYRVTEGEDAQQLSEEVAALHRQSGETPGSLQRIAPEAIMSSVELPVEPWSAFQPGSVVTLGDGRIAVLESTVVSPQYIGGSGRTSPVVTNAYVWIQDGDEWLLDEKATVCLGDCDRYWGNSEEAEATPVAFAVPQDCVSLDEFTADFTSHQQMPVGLRPGPGNQSGATVATIPSKTPLQFLCEFEATSNPQIDRMDDGQVWLKVRTEDSTAGWIREIDVQVTEP